MRKLTTYILLLLCMACTVYAQNNDKYLRVSVAFYNLENLFDTIHETNNDYEFLPNGDYQWTNKRYQKKLHNMAYAISQIATNEGPDIIGFAEIENRGVLEDLLKQPELKNKGYKIVHYDSPDHRGIDCALFYKPNIFKVTNSKPHPVNIPNEPWIKTRDVLEVDGIIAGEPTAILVGHWPSRAGGEEISLKRRIAAGLVMKHVTDSLMKANPKVNVILMGDFNDDPTSPSIKKGLNSVDSPTKMTDNTLFNPMEKLYEDGIGTLAYRDVWNLFDNILVNKSLIDSTYKTLAIYKSPKDKYWGHIFNAKFLTDERGRFKGYPHRTFSYGQFINGYSDHYPSYIYLVKKISR